MSARRIVVVGHVEHITIGRVGRLPVPGEIVHLADVTWFPGGGGGMAFAQLLRLPDTELHLFTAVGDDEAGAQVRTRLDALGDRVHVHRADRAAPHTRDVVMVTPEGERTIVVVGMPLQPTHADPLPWHVMDDADAVYFTARDPEILRVARGARRLVVTARRRPALDTAGVTADLVIGSVRDPDEQCTRGDFAHLPRALVLTDGARGGTIDTDEGTRAFASIERVTHVTASTYGAGDSFAGALMGYLACGVDLDEACRRAAAHGAAVLRGATLDPWASQRDFDLR